MATRTHHRGRNVEVHRALAAIGDPVTVDELTTLMDATRDVVRQQVYRLQSAGYVRVVRSAGRHFVYELTDAGRENVPDVIEHAQVGSRRALHVPSMRPADGTDFRNQPSVAPVIGTTTRTAGFPLLAQLRNRTTIRSKLREAAALLPQGDVLRDEMHARAEALVDLTPLEAEYLRYASDCEGHRGGRA